MRGTATSRLARLARQVGAERAPYYVRRSAVPPALEATFPADGWYWVPPEHTFAVFLGANEVDAAIKLHNLSREQERRYADTG